MNTKSVAVIELSEFEYAQEISVEDIIRQDIVSDPGIHDEFLSNGGFFLLEAKLGLSFYSFTTFKANITAKRRSR
mgnify:CR=1 FL=1